MIFSKRSGPVAVNSWYIYTRIYASDMNFLFWGFIVMIPGALALGLYFAQFKKADPPVWLLYVGLICLGAFGLRIVFEYLQKIVRFFFYRNWEKSLQFELKGWDILGTNPDFPEDKIWDKKTAVSVRLKTAATKEQAKRVHDAVQHLINEANECFYTASDFSPGITGDPRKKWQPKTRTSAGGAANGQVLGCIYFFIHRDLRKIHRTEKVIDSVDVSLSGELMEIGTIELPGDVI